MFLPPDCTVSHLLDALNLVSDKERLVVVEFEDQGGQSDTLYVVAVYVDSAGRLVISGSCDVNAKTEAAP